MTSYCEGRERKEEILENKCQAVIREESSPIDPPVPLVKLNGNPESKQISGGRLAIEISTKIIGNLKLLLCLSDWLVGRDGKVLCQEY